MAACFVQIDSSRPAVSRKPRLRGLFAMFCNETNKLSVILCSKLIYIYIEFNSNQIYIIILHISYENYPDKFGVIRAPASAPACGHGLRNTALRLVDGMKNKHKHVEGGRGTTWSQSFF